MSDFKAKMPKIEFRWGSAPDHAGGALYSASTDPLAVLYSTAVSALYYSDRQHNYCQPDAIKWLLQCQLLGSFGIYNASHSVPARLSTTYR